MASKSKMVIIAALIGNTMVAATKFVASAITGSSAIFSDAIHSVVDTGNQVLMLYGMKRASLPADTRFPFVMAKKSTSGAYCRDYDFRCRRRLICL